MVIVIVLNVGFLVCQTSPRFSTPFPPERWHKQPRAQGPKPYKVQAHGVRNGTGIKADGRRMKGKCVQSGWTIQYIYVVYSRPFTRHVDCRVGSFYLAFVS